MDEQKSYWQQGYDAECTAMAGGGGGGDLAALVEGLDKASASEFVRGWTDASIDGFLKCVAGDLKAAGCDPRVLMAMQQMQFIMFSFGLAGPH